MRTRFLMPCLLAVSIIISSSAQAKPFDISVSPRFLDAHDLRAFLQVQFPVEFKVDDLGNQLLYSATEDVDRDILAEIKKMDQAHHAVLEYARTNASGEMDLITGVVEKYKAKGLVFDKKNNKVLFLLKKADLEAALNELNSKTSGSARKTLSAADKSRLKKQVLDKLPELRAAQVAKNAKSKSKKSPIRVTKPTVIKLKNVKPTNLDSILSKKFGILIDSNDGKKTLTFTAYPSLAEQIKSEIQTLDSKEVLTRHFVLQHLSAKEVMAVVKSRFKPKSIVVDTVNNGLIMSGYLYELVMAESLLETIDIPQKSYRNVASTKSVPITSKVFWLKYSGATQIALQLNSHYNKIDKKYIVTADPARNAIIATAPSSILSEMKNLISQLDIANPPSLSQLEQSTSIPVYYRSLKEAEKIVKAHFKQIVVTKDDSTRSLIVSGSRRTIDSLKGFIRGWDRKPPTILVEGTILNVNHNKIHEVGVAWANTLNTQTNRAAGASRVTTTKTDATASFLSANLANLVYEWSSPSGRLYSMTLGALVSEGAVDISVKPHITFISGGEGSFEQKRNIPQVTSSDRGTNVNFTKAGLSLEVGGFAVPLVEGLSEEETKYRIVLNKLKLEDGRVGTQVAATTAVAFFSSVVTFESPQIVNDGDLIIVGGSMERNITKTISRVPILGDIPILRVFFRSNKDDVRVVETMALLRISVVRENDYEHKAAQFKESKDLRPIEFGGKVKDSIHEHPLKTSIWSSTIIYEKKGGYFELVHDKFTRPEMKTIERQFKKRIRGRIDLVQEWDNTKLVRKLVMSDKGLRAVFDGMAREFGITPYEVLIIARHIGSIDDRVFSIY
ncbi:MAG: hypothetical protein JKX97_07625, partial [Candidatus Lindowbacteria bacterium]|nr:hypothetical protein [Candidatus Lindowbacteria bacterium]